MTRQFFHIEKKRHQLPRRGWYFQLVIWEESQEKSPLDPSRIQILDVAECVQEDPLLRILERPAYADIEQKPFPQS